jgi:hypothetical protein
MRFMIERPWLVLAYVARDAAQDIAARTERGFDNQSDMRATLVAGQLMTPYGSRFSHSRERSNFLQTLTDSLIVASA